MRDILPPFVFRQLRDHFYARVGQAESSFRHFRADEDSLTGALGQSLLEPQKLWVGPDGEQFVWSTTFHKVRGRGHNAPEKRYGIDGVFELEVVDVVTGTTRRKGLLFQAKNGWQTADRKLLAQTIEMRRLNANGIVIDYADGDYRAFDAGDVVEAGGRRAEVPAQRHYRLAEVLGDQFLECTRGVIGLHYDPDAEVVRVPAAGDAVAAAVNCAIVTEVLRVR